MRGSGINENRLYFVVDILDFDFNDIIICIKQLKELKERQKMQLRQKAMKKGLDPE